MPSRLIQRVVLPRRSRAEIRRPSDLGDQLPTVSVVIPCYNYGHYLPGCIDSVLGQPGVRAEVVVVDDASSDNSAAIAAEYAQRDPRVRVLRHEVNRGHIATYNDGLDQIRGDYVALLSADDLLTPGSLRRATALMEHYPSVGLTYGFKVDFSGPQVPAARTAPTSWIIWPGHKWLGHICAAGRNFVQSPEVLMRTSVLRTIGGYRAELPHSGDLEMWLRAAAVADVGYIVGADQAFYRVHQSNMHHSFDLLADVTHRMKAFDAFFDGSARSLPDADRLHDTAKHTLAAEALRHAISAYARRAGDTEPIKGFADFAAEVWPGIRRSRDWRALDRLADLPESRLRRDLWLRRRERARDLRYSWGWWRRRWVGVD